jgi:hypothetical protein
MGFGSERDGLAWNVAWVRVGMAWLGTGVVGFGWVRFVVGTARLTGRVGRAGLGRGCRAGVGEEGFGWVGRAGRVGKARLRQARRAG